MKKLSIMLIALILTIVLVVPIGTAAAAPEAVEVNGTVTFVMNYLSDGRYTGTEGDVFPGFPPGIIWHGELGHAVAYTGDINGRATELLDGFLNWNRGALPDLLGLSRGTQEFTGTVAGRSGTFTAHIRHELRLDGSGKVEETIVSGTGDLTGMRGSLVFMIYRQDNGSYKGTYSGTFHFAP